MNAIQLIADSGSTKTEWALLPGSQVFHTQGINPFHQEAEAIAAILRDELLPQLPVAGAPLSVHFYGSGVRPELQPLMERILRQTLPRAEDVEAQGDLLGAARALCGRQAGIACILGTGANSGLYNGEKIVQNTPPLGYILGDEGSGAVLGARFLNALYKGRLSRELEAEFHDEYQMDMADVVSRVYRQPLANRWLASLSPFIHRHLFDPAVRSLVVQNFSDFFERNVASYQRADLPVSFVGSIAWHYRTELAEAAASMHYKLGDVCRSPLDGLLAYHTLDS